MKHALIAGLALAAMATPALAAAQHFVVEDTTRFCSVIDVQPSKASNLRILGNSHGYGSRDAAEAALKSVPGCKSKA